MSKTTKTLLYVAAFGAAAYFVYRHFSMGKQRKANYIFSQGYNKEGIRFLLSLDEGFLEAWYKAAKKSMPTFTYNGLTYSTQGGKRA